MLNGEQDRAENEIAQRTRSQSKHPYP